MPSEITWLPDAVRDVQRLRNFIQEKNPDAAKRAATRIKEAANLLLTNPEVGKPVEDCLPYRELLIPFGNGNYVLRYREDGLHIIIVKIKHSREKAFKE